jgi:hypothetical protein
VRSFEGSKYAATSMDWFCIQLACIHIRTVEILDHRFVGMHHGFAIYPRQRPRERTQEHQTGAKCTHVVKHDLSASYHPISASLWVTADYAAFAADAADDGDNEETGATYIFGR